MNMQQYIGKLFSSISSISCTDADGGILEPQQAVDCCSELFIKYRDNKGKIMVVGNGGSAAIASHTAVDYMKNGGMYALCFNEAALLTCFANDYGFEHVFSGPLSKYATDIDTLIAISSSGQSKNILNAVNEARSKGSSVVTLSGFSEDNPLRKKGDINIYVPSSEYGFVELSHQIFLHMVLDLIMVSENEKKWKPLYLC
ncbi:MAG: SIS domain-containing protein [Ruminiclostridium sp.]|nr:SIS domain-containing protein [Ruminiclostridium sp.]